MLNVVIFGAPGSGKGTQSELIIKEYGLDHISTGDVLRGEMKAETELGKIAKDYIEKGQLVPDVIIISLATWQKLTEQERNWLRQAADAAAIYQRKLWAEQEKQSLEEMEAHGVEIIYPDKQPFMDAAAPMIERFKNDPVFHDLIDQIQNTHEKDN